MIHDKTIKVKVGSEGVGTKTIPQINGTLKYIKVFIEKPVAVLVILEDLGEAIISEYLSKTKLYSLKTQGDVGIDYKKYSFDTSDYSLNDEITFKVSGQRGTNVVFLLRWSDG